MTKPRKADSVQTFAAAWSEHGIDGADLTTEYRFHPSRRWRLDIAFPSQKVGVEIDGFGYGHQSKPGRIADNEKQNALVLSGWRVLRFTTADLTASRIRDTVETVGMLLCGVEEQG